MLAFIQICSLLFGCMLAISLAAGDPPRPTVPRKFKAVFIENYISYPPNSTVEGVRNHRDNSSSSNNAKSLTFDLFSTSNPFHAAGKKQQQQQQQQESGDGNEPSSSSSSTTNTANNNISPAAATTTMIFAGAMYADFDRNVARIDIGGLASDAPIIQFVNVSKIEQYTYSVDTHTMQGSCYGPIQDQNLEAWEALNGAGLKRADYVGKEEIFGYSCDHWTFDQTFSSGRQAKVDMYFRPEGTSTSPVVFLVHILTLDVFDAWLYIPNGFEPLNPNTGIVAPASADCKPPASTSRK